MKKKKLSIFSIKSKQVHLIIKSYVPKEKLLQIAKYSKKMQSLTNISIEDYKIHHLQYQSEDKDINLDDKADNVKENILSAIIELTQSFPLDNNHQERDVPYPIYTMIETSSNKIIASTESSLLIIDNKTFDILKEIPIHCSGAVIHLIDLGENQIVLGTFSKCIKIINIETEEIINEITGSNPLLLSNNLFAFIWESKIIRITSKNASVAVGDIEIDEIHNDKINNEDYFEEFCVISCMIELMNKNILICSWNGCISEYDVNSYKCIQKIKLNIEYIDYLYELNDERIAFCVNDNAHIYIFNKYDDDINGNLITLKGHTNNVIQIMQLKRDQIISASSDGKIKFWVKNKYDYFNCSLTLYLFNDYIRKFILLKDGRICVTSDEKCIRALGVNNYTDEFTIRFISKKEDSDNEKDKDNEIKRLPQHPNSFEFIDNRFN